MLNDDSTITNINIDDATAEISLYSLVVANGLDRRNTLRLRYHSEHFEPLPHVKISEPFSKNPRSLRAITVLNRLLK